MKSKLEAYLDKEFEMLKIKPHIYHFIDDIEPFNAITIADSKSKTEILTWKDMNEIIVSNAHLDNEIYEHDKATRLFLYLKQSGIYGVAICNKRDTFNRQRGRIISKGRLLKHIKEK